LVHKGIVLSVEALLSLSAAVLFIGAMDYGAHDTNYLRVYEYQVLQDVLDAAMRDGTLAAWADGRIGSAEAGARIAALLDALGNFCIGVEADGRSMSNCAAGGDAVAAHRMLALRNGYSALHAKLSSR
jgi:hypothetical protein